MTSGYYIVGVDEVGVGSMAGPVVSCAIIQPPFIDLSKEPRLSGVRDSKALTPRERERLASEIKKTNIAYSISYSYPHKIDSINIRNAALRSMGRAVSRVIKKTNVLAANIMVLIDGPNRLPHVRHSQRAIIKGDQKVFLISCASILAKVYRDNMMRKYAKKYPEYGFEKHKGYGTASHRVALAKFGASKIHRKSFKFT